MAYEVLESKKVYQGKLVTVTKDVISMPDHHTAIRETVHWKNASAIIPVDEQGNILFVRQYRHSFQKECLEIPAGKIEPGESPLCCAKRELQEETGCSSDTFSFLCEIETAVAFSTQTVFLYVAQNLVMGKPNFDEDEFITIEKYSLPQAMNMIFQGKIKDGKTVAAILAYYSRNK